MLTLFSYPELYGLADNNPYGLKVFAFLKLCRLAMRMDALDELEIIVERQIDVEWSAAEAKAHRRAIDFLRTQREIATAPPPLAAE